MNKSMIRYVLGYLLMVEGVLLLLPCLVALIYQEKVGFYYLAVAIPGIIIGKLICLKKPKNFVFYLKEGCVTTALSWVLLSVYGALPFWITREIPDLVDAVFETASGFTTTGASILNEVEPLTHCALFWRSFTHWVGGMGVLVFLLMIIPLSGGSHFNLMRAESPGPSVSKLKPKIKTTARILYLLYLGLTLMEMILLLCGGMPFFDAITTSFGTAGTGGFGIKNDSIGGYSAYIQWVVTVFMILFGINFNAYYLIIFGKWKKALAMEEVRYYLGIIAVAIGIIFANVYRTFDSVAEAIRHSSFQVASIITTTGFSTADFDKWSGTAKMTLVLLMFIGACAGSTGGGMKVSRIVILVKTVAKELHSYIHPKSIRKVKFEGKPVEHEVVRATNVYFIAFILIFTVSIFIVSFEGKDLITNFTAIAATINNIGPGLELVGPTANFGHFNHLSKIVMIFDMLAGRLELFPLLILFHPVLWKETIQSGISKKGKKRR